MAHPTTRTVIACRNCGARATMNFCAACGQETALHPPTLGEFVHEFVGHYVALEGALWRTLGLLLARPGHLTREYLAGRRRRYVLPLRLYLTASFVFFLVLKLMPAAVDQVVVFDGPARTETTTAATRPVDCGAAGEQPCNPLERLVNHVGERYHQDPAGFAGRLQSQLISTAPYAVFLLLPVFAGIVTLAYRSRRMTYGEHVVFSLHLHSFWFLVLLLVALLPGAVGDVLLWVVPVYGVWAMHEVYRGGWGTTLLRAAFVSIAYFGVLLLASMGLVAALLAKA